MKKVDDPVLVDAVERMVRERFGDADIDHILLSEDVDEDGDAIIDVMVIYSTKPDVSRIKGLARNIWADLSKRGAGFPVLSFRSAAEHSKLTRAAA